MSRNGGNTHPKLAGDFLIAFAATQTFQNFEFTNP